VEREKRVAVVSHKATLRLILRDFLGIDPRGYAIAIQGAIAIRRTLLKRVLVFRPGDGASLLPMRTRPPFRRAFGAGALFAALLLIGCNDAKHTLAPPAPGDPNAITIEVQATPTQFKAGETIEIMVTTRNPSSGPVTLGFSSGCIQMFNVQNKNGTVVAPLDLVCALNAPSVTLEPGETIRNTFLWSGTTGLLGGGTKLPAGDYQITGLLNAFKPILTSAPVDVKILP
jgi:intracellular proteinase inhibitor BsuPI